MDGVDVVATCPTSPRCRRYDCHRAKDLATALLDQYRGANLGVDLAQGDFDAGEWEVAAISVIESVDVPTEVVDALAALADQCFEKVDADVARRVVAKKQQR